MARSTRSRSCTVCFKPVGQRTAGACPHCGAWIRPSLDDELSSPHWAYLLGKRPGRPWVLLLYLTVALVLGVVLVGTYAVSEQGQARLLELAYQFMVFDGGVKKIARYQQYFAVKATIDRVSGLKARERATQFSPPSRVIADQFSGIETGVGEVAAPASRDTHLAQQFIAFLEDQDAQ